MPEARVLSLATNVRPAVGAGGRLPRSVLLKRAAVAVALAVLLVAAKLLVSAATSGRPSLNATGGGRTVAAGLDVGSAPADSDLQALAASYHVSGVVNVGDPSVAEQAAAASLHLGYRHLRVPPGGAPTWAQLRALTGFLRHRTGSGAAVYLHGNAGGGRTVVTAAMLLLVRGDSWATVAGKLTTAQLDSLSDRELLAVHQLKAALDGSRRLPANDPYAAARVVRW